MGIKLADVGRGLGRGLTAWGGMEQQRQGVNAQNRLKQLMQQQQFAQQDQTAANLASVQANAADVANTRLGERDSRLNQFDIETASALAGTRADAASALNARLIEQYGRENPLVDEGYPGLGDQSWYPGMRDDDLWGRAPISGSGGRKNGKTHPLASIFPAWEESERKYKWDKDGKPVIDQATGLQAFTGEGIKKTKEGSFGISREIASIAEQQTKAQWNDLPIEQQTHQKGLELYMDNAIRGIQTSGISMAASDDYELNEKTGNFESKDKSGGKNWGPDWLGENPETEVLTPKQMLGKIFLDKSSGTVNPTIRWEKAVNLGKKMGLEIPEIMKILGDRTDPMLGSGEVAPAQFPTQQAPAIGYPGESPLVDAQQFNMPYVEQPVPEQQNFVETMDSSYNRLKANIRKK